jgi:hypothetical protein
MLYLSALILLIYYFQQLDHLSIEDSGDLNAVRSGPKKEEWAIKVDINSPVEDFHKRIPDMAYKVRKHITCLL